jgi:hypothetical protein
MNRHRGSAAVWRLLRRWKMNPRQMLGITGSAILFVGVFAPMVSAPFVGSLNYFQNGANCKTPVLQFQRSW